MALRKLSREDTQAFLERAPGLLGVVGTLGADGYPHLVAVWYRYDGERIFIWTLEKRTWVQNAVRDDRVAFSVQEEAGESRGVSIKGRAKIATGDDEWIQEEIRRITRRYVTEQAEIEPYIHAWQRLRTIVTLTPEGIHAWYDEPEG